jgi:adenylyltransferase/sulfurtransferase
MLHVFFWPFCRLNPLGTYVAHTTPLGPSNALAIMTAYDIVLDCTDNPASRYLISDACVLLNKPLVSASALRTEGQLMVLNDPPLQAGDATGGPCYRCVFPRPPPPETVVSCGEGGILGPVVGVMGVLQALETIKVVVGAAGAGAASSSERKPELLLYAAYQSPRFRTVRLRRRKAGCAACSGQATVTRESIESGSMDYVRFCGSAAPVTDLLGPDERVSPQVLADALKEKKTKHLVIDVREKVQFDLCHLPGSFNFPFSDIEARTSPPDRFDAFARQLHDLVNASAADARVYVVCRLGNDSQTAVKRFKELGVRDRWVGDVQGGLRAWRQHVDGNFPDY